MARQARDSGSNNAFQRFLYGKYGSQMHCNFKFAHSQIYDFVFNFFGYKSQIVNLAG
jgi:hypothetical protein